MFFSTLTFYQLKPMPINLDLVVSKAEEKALKACGSQEEYSFGWSPLLRDTQQWGLIQDSCLLLRAVKEEKHLPSQVVREELERKVSEIEALEGRKIGRKEKADMKDEVVFTLRPKSFTKKSDIWMYIDLKEGIIVINSANATQIDLLLKLLADTLDCSPMRPLQAQSAPSDVITDWLLNNTLPPSLETGDECHLTDNSEDKASVKFKSLEPLSQDVTQHLETGMKVKTLALKMSETLSMTINSDLSISKVKFDDLLKDKAFEDSQGGGLSDMDAQFSIMTLTVRALFKRLTEWFSLVKPEQEEDAA